MTQVDSALERLAPAPAWSPNWADVLARADEEPRQRRHLSRRLILVLAVLAAILIPLAALAASNNWWFFGPGQSTPQPIHAPVVVKSGEWGGHAWQLVAYPSTTDGLCYVVTPAAQAQTGTGSAMSCAPFVGVPRTDKTKPTPDLTITFLTVSRSADLPAYIAGPVIPTASTVAIQLANGTRLTTSTFTAPEPLARVRFYATPITSTPTATVEWVAGLNASGTVIACLAPGTAHNGDSPLNSCR